MTKESRYIEQKEIEIHVEILKIGAKLQLFFYISKKSSNFAGVLRSFHVVTVVYVIFVFHENNENNESNENNVRI